MTAEKCCLFLKLETGCLLLGLTTFLLSTAKMLTVAAFLKMELCSDPERVTHEAFASNLKKANVTQHHIMGLHLSTSVMEIVMSFVIIIMFLWMTFSVLMIIGILKKHVNFVMAYFLFGIAISILYLLSGLLVVISGHWICSIITFVLTLVYIKCLTFVYAVYDKIRQEKSLDDQEELINDIDDPMIEY